MLTTILGAIGTASIAAFGWAFSINSKVQVQNQRVDDLKELINVRFDALDRNIDKRLTRVEKALNGRLDHVND